ncbi:Tat pathway signal protein [Kitasatospora kifunensis]|uniref:Tetratricopeptide (TPR) repeat protein n=1 Tax=Kitasatospora kifunensis TaxID=58351 RepID=A0A7W7VZR0_KITKI|nr:Tat pathway signal protein [Kitasatospora kifunensis]MBB4929067.1 tetratricopeptide (TPR) repeat protein [Kitasatospora kifunensis]
MAKGTGNPDLQAWVQASGLSLGEIARRTTALAQRTGHTQVTPDTTRVSRWLGGERPRPPVPELLSQVLGDELGRLLTPSDLGLVPTGVALDTLQVPLLTEPAAATLAGWTRMDLLMPDRRETLKLAAGATLIAVAEHLLGGASRSLTRSEAGFDADSTTALEAVTAMFARLEADHGSGIYRTAIVGQLSEVARRIQDGVPANLRPRVFAATADLAALAGWASHDAGRLGAAQRYWSYALHAATQARVPGRGAEIVTRMSHQMIYLGRLDDALGLLEVAAARADRDGQPLVRALTQSQTGRVHAALGHPDQAARHLDRADDLLADAAAAPAPAWLAYFDGAEHSGARAVSARDLTHLGHRGHPASPHFEAALRLRAPGYERVRAMDQIGLAAALLDEGEPERAAAVGHQALTTAGLESALVASRMNTLLAATDRYRTPEVHQLRNRAADLVARAPLASSVAA